jgi:hypothetical protein
VRVLTRILVTVGVAWAALGAGAYALVQSGKAGSHPTAGRAVEYRVDELLTPVSELCGVHPKPATHARLAAFRRSIAPMARIARRYGDLYYPSYFSESQDVKYGDLFRNWSRWCRKAGHPF